MPLAEQEEFTLPGQLSSPQVFNRVTDNHFSLVSGIGDLGRFWLSCLGPLVLISPNTLNCLAFQSFDFKYT
jgi:hypothetical protein